MTEDNDVNKQPEVNSSPVEAAVESSEQKETVSQPSVGSKEYNWRKMEQRLETLERERNELREAVNTSKAPVEEAPNELERLQDDDLITVGQVNKLAEARARKIIEEELQKREKASLPAKTKEIYKDYDQVVTNENIEQLIKEDPDLEYDIQVSKNPYARAYKAIKQAQFYKERVQNAVNEKRMEDNAAKPVSSNSIGRERPLSHANDYAKGSPDLFEEMQKYRGGSL